jgi:hypothetical protein
MLNSQTCSVLKQRIALPSIARRISRLGVVARVPASVGARLWPGWIAGGLTILAALILLALYVRTVSSGLGDFEAYQSAALAVRHGDRLYEHALAWRDAGFAVNFPGPRPLADRYPGDHNTPFVYPAVFALVFVPVTFLPPEAGRLLWLTIVFGCLLGAAFVLGDLFFPARRLQRIAIAVSLALALAIFQPSRASLTSAQVDSALLLLVALSLSAFVRGHDSRAGIWLALAAAVKPFLGFLVLVFLWKRAYRATATVGALSAVLLLVPALLFGMSTLVDFAVVASYWSSPSFAVSPFNQSLYGLSLRLLTVNAFTVPIIDAPAMASAVRASATVVVMLVLAMSVSRTRTAPTDHLGLELGLAVVAMLLVAPLAQDIYYIHLAIPLVAIAAVIKGSWSRRLCPWALGVGTAAVYLYLCLPTLRSLSMAHYAFHDARISGLQVIQTGAHFYGLAAVAMVTLATVLWHRQLLAGTVRAGTEATASGDWGASGEGREQR